MADRSPGLFDVDTRLAEISAKGDGLERVATLVDFELFRSTREAAAPRRDRSRGGRPPFDHVLMFKVLILQAMHSLSDERAEFLRRVREQGFIDDYSGIRISSKGRRFRIAQATVWNVADAHGNYAGQAATFSKWEFLNEGEVRS